MVESKNRLQDYVIDYSRHLGFGGFANVFLVTRKLDGAKLAMKMLMVPYSGMSETD